MQRSNNKIARKKVICVPKDYNEKKKYSPPTGHVPDGIPGIQGPPGVQGPQGLQGAAGPTGTAGKDGVQMDQILPFMQLLVNTNNNNNNNCYPSNNGGNLGSENPVIPSNNGGNLGSENQVTPTIKGQKGDTGNTSEKGLNGDKGDKGELGEPGSKGDKGELGEQGSKGELGEQGSKGELGEQGSKGELGEQGSKGELGESGPKGDKGELGEQGSKGELGEQGSKGELGEQGSKGELGEPGSKGDIGDKGDNGDKGELGEQGSKGELGEQGSKGDKGDTGEFGKPGEKGQSGNMGNYESFDTVSFSINKSVYIGTLHIVHIVTYLLNHLYCLKEDFYPYYGVFEGELGVDEPIESFDVFKVGNALQLENSYKNYTNLSQYISRESSLIYPTTFSEKRFLRHTCSKNPCWNYRPLSRKIIQGTPTAGIVTTRWQHFPDRVLSNNWLTINYTIKCVEIKDPKNINNNKPGIEISIIPWKTNSIYSCDDQIYQNPLTTSPTPNDNINAGFRNGGNLPITPWTPSLPGGISSCTFDGNTGIFKRIIYQTTLGWPEEYSGWSHCVLDFVTGPQTPGNPTGKLGSSTGWTKLIYDTWALAELWVGISPSTNTPYPITLFQNVRSGMMPFHLPGNPAITPGIDLVQKMISTPVPENLISSKQKKLSDGLLYAHAHIGECNKITYPDNAKHMVKTGDLAKGVPVCCSEQYGIQVLNWTYGPRTTVNIPPNLSNNTAFVSSPYALTGGPPADESTKNLTLPSALNGSILSIVSAFGGGSLNPALVTTHHQIVELKLGNIQYAISDEVIFYNNTLHYRAVYSIYAFKTLRTQIKTKDFYSTLNFGAEIVQDIDFKPSEGYLGAIVLNLYQIQASGEEILIQNVVAMVTTPPAGNLNNAVDLRQAALGYNITSGNYTIENFLIVKEVSIMHGLKVMVSLIPYNFSWLLFGFDAVFKNNGTNSPIEGQFEVLYTMYGSNVIGLKIENVPGNLTFTGISSSIAGIVKVSSTSIMDCIFNLSLQGFEIPGEAPFVALSLQIYYLFNLFPGVILEHKESLEYVYAIISVNTSRTNVILHANSKYNPSNYPNEEPFNNLPIVELNVSLSTAKYTIPGDKNVEKLLSSPAVLDAFNEINKECGPNCGDEVFTTIPGF
jgi:hypothetical protein